MSKKQRQIIAKQLAISKMAQYADLAATISTPQMDAIASAYNNCTYLFESPQIYNPLMKVLDNASAVSRLVSPMTSMLSVIDTSWLQQMNPWLAEVSHSNALAMSASPDINAKFLNLFELEQETSAFGLVSNYFSKMTSVTTQLSFIEGSLWGIAEQWRDIIVPYQLLDSYSTFASQQYALIQKATRINDEKSVQWRLGLLDATSKFIDRQITWVSNFAIDIQEDIDTSHFHAPESEQCVSVIPQYIGYSKRDDKNIDEALAESIITVITEKGKLIVEKIRFIQTLCKTANREILWKNSDLYIEDFITLAGTFCRSTDSLERVVKALYHLFYSQNNILSEIIDLDSLDCINLLKHLKEHRNYPSQTKEISHLQNRLYDCFFDLENIIIERLKTEATSGKGISPESIWAEDTINKNIYKALLHIQGNRIYYGEKEDVLNDGIRDNLRMIYDVKDQTRQGNSPSGKNAGEVDLQICKDGYPIAIIEGLKVSSVRREYIQGHIDKVLTCYDPFGCPYTYIIIYVTVKNFADFWVNCMDYIRDEYQFPYVVKEDFRELNCIHTNLRHAKVILSRNDMDVAVHFFALLIQ